jgi:hypothetical protein
MKTLPAHTKKLLKVSATILLGVIFLVALAWFVDSTKQLYRSGELEPAYGNHSYSQYQHPEVMVNSIKTWMTFDYLNVVFHLPTAYLKTTLLINDPRYPNVRIDYYARHHGLNPLLFLQSIQQAITNYLTGQTLK